MAWKSIGGRRYYYRSVRDGDRVRSEYCGGEFGVLAASLAEEDALERRNARAAEHAEREAGKRFDDALDRLAQEARRAAELLLTENGFHQHKRGEWRKRRAEVN